jgi:hypothetical protein
MPKHHLIISGTGRSGTTFLMQLMTALGLDTGFQDLQSCVFDNCQAGMEWDILHPQAPYIIKGPYFCDELDFILDEYRNIRIDRAIVPVRDLFAAAQSRIDVTLRTKSEDFPNRGVPGGLWDTDIPDFQEPILALKLYHLIYTLAKRDIPLTLLSFPRIVHDPQYLFDKLKFSLGYFSWTTFKNAFDRVAQPHLIHHFSPDSAASVVDMVESAKHQSDSGLTRTGKHGRQSQSDDVLTLEFVA